MTIKIPHHPPRDPLAFKGQIDFWKWYRGYIFYGVTFFVMAFMISISCFYPPYDRDSILFKIGLWIVVCVGVIFGAFRYVYRKHKERLWAFAHGQLITWIVVAHGTKFVLWKSSKDYTISIAIPQGEDFPYILEARNSDKSFHDKHTLKSEITILFDHKTKSAFIPAEVDVEIE
jgi:hypothetical protein